MKQKFYQNEKFQNIFFPILYFLLALGIVLTGCFIFYNKYYQSILVDGASMQPTLVGGGNSGAVIEYKGNNYPIYFRNHYGIADLHQSAVNKLKRFDVCVTYYPDSWSAEDGASIIKRVWGLPGETLNLTYNEENTEFTFTVTKNDKKVCEYHAPIVSITRKYEGEYFVNGRRKFTTASKTFTAAKFAVGNKVFYVNAATRRTFTKTLQNNEYFVMGDNWSASSDSYSNRMNSDLLTKKHLQGRAICINAYASSMNSKAIEIHHIRERYNF